MSASPAKNAAPHTRLDASYLESLFQGAGLAIVACETDGAIVAYNAKAAQLFRNDPNCEAATPVRALFPPAERDAFDERLERCRTALEAVEFRTQFGGSGPDPVEYFVLLTPVIESDGALRGISLWFRDISTQVRMRRDLRHRERLTTLGELCGAMAHHYNNLLCCIATSIEYAMNMNTMTAMRRSLLRAGDAVGRASDITQQLLAFAQADHRATDLCDLTEIVLYFFDENEPRLARQHIELELDWQRIPACPVPREQILIVLNNLVDNAREAMPGGGTLTVTLARRDEHSACLSITDSGGGMDADNFEHLFQPFYTTKGELVSGTGRNAGMGLAVVHGLINEMQGTITASNVPGRGARFDIVLPLNEQA